MIELRNLSKSFGKKTVLKGISARIQDGQIVFVLGKSGVGKSVLLKTIVGLLKADSGEVLVDGECVGSLSEDGLARIRKKCGLIFQFPALLDSISVSENISFGLNNKVPPLSGEEMDDIVREKMELVRLKADSLNRMPNELSFGAQKRVSIARTLAVGPQYLLFDEPTTGMDPVMTSNLNALILNLSKKLKVTAVVVSHDLKSAVKIADRILLLDQGCVVFDGSPSEFRNASVPLARQFMEGISHV